MRERNILRKKERKMERKKDRRIERKKETDNYTSTNVVFIIGMTMSVLVFLFCCMYSHLDYIFLK